MRAAHFGKVVSDIKSLKIQGAESIAREAVKSLKIIIHTSKAKTPTDFMRDVESARRQLFSARPTEPFLRNYVDYTISGVDQKSLKHAKISLFNRVQKTLLEMESNKKLIAEIGAKKIKDGMIVFTHCHSSTVTSILIEAKRQGRNFAVYNTETRPMLQGRKTALELSGAGIKVRHFVDAAARLALKNSDIMLIGADAITSEGAVVNKIGSELFAEAAERRGIPVYSCTSSLKFDPKTIFGFDEAVEVRPSREIWARPPKNVIIDNHAFEIVSPNLITGIITELGIFQPSLLIPEIRSRYKWMTGKGK